MTIAAGSKILATDYNTIQSNIVNIIGAGSAQSGYGLTYSATPVAGSNYSSIALSNVKITAAHWATLKADILLAAYHQGITSNTSILSLVGASFTGVISSTTLTVSSVTGTIAIGDPVWGANVTPGTYITAGSGTTWTITPSQTAASSAMRSGGNIQAGDRITAKETTIFPTAVTAITTNQFLNAEYSDESFSPTLTNSRTTSWGSAVNPTVTHAFTIDFTTSANARYYFNSGGNIQMSASRSGGTVSTQNTNWTTLLSSIGTISFNYNSTVRSGTGGTGSSIGFYNLTTTNQTVFTGSGTGSYSTNTYTVLMRCDVASNTTGTARYVYVTINFTDTHTNTFSDSVDGTLTSTIARRRATGTHVVATAPTASNTTLLTA